MMQSFDELYVISDLHLGGREGFQIFNQGETLTAFIKRLAGQQDRRVGLVLNGDTVDFLAEAGSEYLDPLGAVNKLKRIFTETPAFAGILTALQEFVAEMGHQLIIVLGNHDVELALPEARQWLLENISAHKPEARSRVTLCLDGAGFACDVGGKRVFCIHGNDVDVWNFVDLKQLRDICLALNVGQTPRDWDPNAGTRMVIDVMNTIKHQYPIVDLLKPEVEAVVPILLCLKPDCVKEITRILKVVAYLSRDAVLRAVGFLSAEEEMRTEPLHEEEVLANFAADYFDYGTVGRMNAAALIAGAYQSMEAEEKAVGAGRDAVPPASQDEQFLGPWDYIKAIFSRQDSKAEKLRQALKKNLEHDQTFTITHPDDMFQKIDKLAGGNTHYLITGHTHLERAIARSAPGSYYYNSGTWIRLIQLTDAILDNDQEFARAYNAFESGTMADLDAIQDLGESHNQPLVSLKPTVVAIMVKDGQTFGELHYAQKDGTLKPVRDTRLPRG